MQSSASTLALVRESAHQKQADDEAERARQKALPKKKPPRQLPPVGGADDASVSSKSSKRKPKRSRSKPAPRGAASDSEAPETAAAVPARSRALRRALESAHAPGSSFGRPKRRTMDDAPSARPRRAQAPPPASAGWASTTPADLDDDDGDQALTRAERQHKVCARRRQERRPALGG